MGIWSTRGRPSAVKAGYFLQGSFNIYFYNNRKMIFHFIAGYPFIPGFHSQEKIKLQGIRMGRIKVDIVQIIYRDIRG